MPQVTEHPPQDTLTRYDQKRKSHGIAYLNIKYGEQRKCAYACKSGNTKSHIKEHPSE